MGLCHPRPPANELRSMLLIKTGIRRWTLRSTLENQTRRQPLKSSHLLLSPRSPDVLYRETFNFFRLAPGAPAIQHPPNPQRGATSCGIPIARPIIGSGPRTGFPASTTLAGIALRLLIHQRCGRLVETLPSLQHDPNRPEDVLKVDAGEDGVGGDGAGDALSIWWQRSRGRLWRGT